jgi:hypothetical protein
MASESRGTYFDARVLKYCAGITNVVVIFIFALEGHRVSSILKMFTFMSSKIIKFLKTSKGSFFEFTKFFNL